MQITSDFDSGNIICLKVDTPADIKLAIQKDNNSDFYQWFHFCLSGARGQACVMTIENASGAAFTGGWDDYNACASYDKTNWFRVPTDYKNGDLIIKHTPDQDEIYYAYFAPYTMERHENLIAKSVQCAGVLASVLGQTLDGQNLDKLTIGSLALGKKVLWLISRQHPGESMAEWWMEGFLGALLDTKNEVACSLREKCVFHIVPNMNPDGSKRGHLRTNACGANLNREWNIATKDRSPEVLLVMNEMHKTGVDFCFDIHGDEALPYNFVAAAEGVARFDEKHAHRLEQFLTAYKNSTPEFQTKHGYPIDASGSANLTMCTNYVAQTHDCLAMTLEMPFKDNADMPDAKYGWSPERAKKLGADALPAILDVWELL